MATDPVCGMTVDEKSAATTRVHAGTTYYFCSTHCGAKFEANPAGYLKKQAEPTPAHKSHALDQAGVLSRGWNLHPPGLRADLSPRNCARRSRPRMARRFLLSMSCLQIRSRGKGVQKRSGADQSGNSSARLFERFPPDHRHRRQVVENQKCEPCGFINIFPHEERSNGNRSRMRHDRG